MKLKICKKCKRPYLANKESCPNCPEPYTWDQESWANVGCLVAMILPLVFLIFVWVFFFFAIFFK